MTTDLRQRLQLALGSAYSLERELGGGGMSRVFAARDTSLGRTVVVKVLPPELAAGVSIERFKREIALAARLQHPSSRPYYLSPRWLRIDPTFGPLRGDPRFEKLIAGRR